MSARHIISDVFLWLGVAVILIACLGVLVLRDVYDRLHFSSPTSLGALCIAVAVLVKDSFSTVGDKAILVAVFLIVTAPIVTHATARAARIATSGDWRPAEEDEVEVEDP